jgi:PAS domain S-box-containing protein
MSEKKASILLVEDEESHADLICRSFESASVPVSVTVVRNLHEVRSSISKSTPDLIIADFLLPDGKGIELIPADKEKSPYPVIILTSHGDEKIAVEAMKAGAFDYIVKSEVTLDNMPRICERIMREWDHTIERRKAVDALSKSEEKYRNLVETAQDAIVCDINGIIVDWNKSAERVFGYSKDEIIGKPVNVLLPNRYKNEHQVGFDRFTKTGEAGIIGKTVEVSRLTKKGVEILIEMSLTYQKIENEQHFFTAIIRDITERRKSEQQLRKLSHAVKYSSTTIFITDIKGNIEYANPEFTRLTGYSIEEAIGKNPRFLQSNVTSPEVHKELWETITSGKEWQGEFCNKKKNGELYWESASISPVKNDKGEITNFIAVKKDITEHKKMEEVLLQTEKLKALGVITSGVAHDFNNILAIVSGNAQLLQERHSDDKELAADRLSTIRKAASDGAEIVRRMRKFMAVEKDVSEFMSVNIKDVIEQSVDFTMPRWMNMARAGGIKYDIDMKGVKEVPTIPGNPSELREVLINIINNALDVMPEGGTILICTWSNDKNVYTSISDTGTGMTEEVRKKIFDPFFTTKRAEGSGLGMSVSYGIIKSHGGNIDVESKDGAGSTFTLTFPIDRENRQSKVSPEQTHEIRLKKLRILVIDDEEEICSILEESFSKDGHDVKSVISGTVAIKILKGEEFDLVLCDLVMPDLSGHDVIEIVDKLDKKPKIGLITGWDEEIETKEKEKLKVDFIIKKPFVLSEITKQINNLGI